MLKTPHRKLGSHASVISIAIVGAAGLLVTGAFLFSLAQEKSVEYPDASEYAPNLWFDSSEKYYPSDPLDFYFDENLNEIPGKDAVAKYDSLSQEDKVKNVKVFYKIDDTGSELVYQYWLFYVMNNYENGHYGDWESAFVFIDKDSGTVNKVVGSAHGSGHNLEIRSKETKHIWLYVGNGSHASCPDEIGDGKCDFLLWNLGGQGMEWSAGGGLGGRKVVHDHYTLHLFENLYVQKFQSGKSFSEDKSPILGLNLYKTFQLNKFGLSKPKEDKYYNLPLVGNYFGKTPTFAWEKEEYKNPEKMLESTPTRIAKKASGFFGDMGSAIASMGKALSKPAGLDFGGPASVTTKDDDITDITDTAEISGVEVEIADVKETGQTIPIAAVPTVQDLRNDDMGGRTPAHSTSSGQAPELETELAFVKKVIDGDTIELASGQRVRYIGIDTPENLLECYAEEAKQRNKSLIEGKQVILMKGLGVKEKDKYDRLLRFAWLDLYGDGKIDSSDTFVNLDLLERGYARENDYGQTHAYKHRFEAAEQEAKRQEIGLWGEACNKKAEAIKETTKDIVQAAEKIADNLAALRPFEIAPNVFKFPPPSSGGPAPTPVPTPTPTPTPEPAKRIVINEIQTGNSEFVELYNQFSSAKSLTGYYFSYYSSSKTAWNDPWRNKKFPDGASIPASGYYLIGLKDYPIFAGNPDADWQAYTSSQLADSVGTVAIFSFDPSATTSEVAYNSRADAVGWGSGLTLYEQSPASAPDSGKSVSRSSSHADTDNNSNDFSVSASTTPINSSGKTYDSSFSAAPLWAMFQKDAKHSGLAALAGPTWTSTPQATSSWIFEVSGGRSQPVIDYAGIIYVTDSLGIVHALNANGTEKWAFNPDNQSGVGAGYAASSPALSSDSQRVYSVYTDNGERKLWLFSIKASDGILDWKYATGEDGYNQGVTTPVLDSSGNIYFASQQSIYSVSSSGALNWEKNLSPSRLGLKTPAIDNSGGYIYVSGVVSNTGGDRYIWKLNTSDGSEVWKQNPTGNNNLSNGVSLSATGTVYTGGNNDSRLYSVSPTDGSKNWDAILTSGSVKGPIPIFDLSGNIYIGASGTFDSGALNKVSATGTLLWAFTGANLGASSYPAVIDSQGRVYFGAKDKYVYAVKPEDGSEIWKYQLSGEPVGFAIGKDVVYVVSYDGKIYALK